MKTPGNLSKLSALITAAVILLLPQLQRFKLLGLQIKDSDMQFLFLYGILLALGLLAFNLLFEQPGQLSDIHKDIKKLSSEVNYTFRLLSQPPEVAGFYKDRDALRQATNYPEYVSVATEEIFAIGVTLAFYAIYKRKFIKDKAREGCRIRFLLPSPKADGQESPLMSLIQEHFDAKPQYAGQLKHSIQSLSELKDDGVELRVYSKALPTMGYTILDGRLPSGKMLVELYPYKCSPDERPSFELKRREEKGLFDSLYNQCERLWEDSNPV